jgi:hypothetical protein
VQVDLLVPVVRAAVRGVQRDLRLDAFDSVRSNTMSPLTTERGS